MRRDNDWTLYRSRTRQGNNGGRHEVTAECSARARVEHRERQLLGDVLDVVVVTDDNEVVDTGPDGGCEVDRVESLDVGPMDPPRSIQRGQGA